MKRSLCTYLVLGVLCCGKHSAPAAPEATTPAKLTIGFRSKNDLFECLPGDKVSLEKLKDRTTMRWDVNYANNGRRACIKKFRPGTVSGMETMSFRIRSDSKKPLWLQVNEASGEGFFEIITPGSGWKTISLRLADFTLNKDKVANGRLDLDQITKILIVDVSAFGGQANGKRTVWFSGWEFTSQETTGKVNKSEPQRAKTTNPVPVKKLSTGKVGIVAGPRNYRETEETWLDFFTKAKEAGVQIISLQPGYWDKHEQRFPGVYKWPSWDKFFSVVDKHGIDFEFSKDMGGPFFHDKLHVPKDIEFESFTDPVLLNRYNRRMTSFLDRFGRRLRYITIHAEGANTYFEKYPDQFDDYCQFLSEVRKHIQRHSPHIQVGVLAYRVVNDHLLARMGEATDFTAYDIMKGKRFKRPADFERLVKRLIQLAKGKKIAFQHAGWSTSKTDESSDQEQVEFIREFYRVLYQYRDKIEYASIGAVYDHDPSIVGPAFRAQFSHYPEAFVDKIIDSMCNFGLFRNDGTPKPGWYELKKQIAAYYQRLGN